MNKFVLYDGEPREREDQPPVKLGEKQVEHYKLKPTLEVPGGGFAPVSECSDLPHDKELLIKPVSEMTDAELEEALEMAESQRMSISDTPSAKNARKKTSEKREEIPINASTNTLFAEVEKMLKEGNK